MNDKLLESIIAEGKMIFCFDIDGTIAEIVSKTESKPITEMINLVNERYDRGDYIHLYTARNFDNCRDITEKWLLNNKVKYHELHFGKPKAHLYIDDGAVNSEHYLLLPEYADKIFKQRGDNINKLLK